MIRIHDKQLGDLGVALGLEQFEDDMVAHLYGFSPRHSEVIGDDWLRRTIRLGIERAAVYGVTNPGLLRFYVELMVMYGSAFDVDPLQPWAGKVLRDPRIPDEVTRIDLLYEAYRGYREVVSDPDGRAPIQALRNLAQILGEGTPLAELRTEQRALEKLVQSYPQRCAYLGEPQLLQLIHRAPEEAARNDMAMDAGVVLATGMMFAIGPAFGADPLYPWIMATLRDPAIKSAERRAERLEKRIRIYVTRAVEYLERKRTHVR